MCPFWVLQLSLLALILKISLKHKFRDTINYGRKRVDKKTAKSFEIFSSMLKKKIIRNENKACQQNKSNELLMISDRFFQNLQSK